MPERQNAAGVAPVSSATAEALDLPNASQPPPRTGVPRIAGTPALLLLASVVVVMLAASSTPTPMYAIYQRQWGFSPIITTIVFAVYAIAVLVALLFTGRLSDWAGRRPVLLVAMAIQVVSLLVYADAGGVGMLLAARIVQGLSTGLAFGTVGGALIDFDSQRGPIANAMALGPGCGLGSLVSALFVQFLPAPTTLIYLALAGLVLLQAVGVALLRETVTRSRIPWSVLMPEIKLPHATRSALLTAGPVLLAIWALFGLYGALGPLLAQTLAVSSSVVLGGAVLAVFGATTVATVYLLRRAPAGAVMLTAILALIIGAGVCLAALSARSAPLFFVGTAVSGIAFGGGFQSGVRTVVPFAERHERAGVMSLLFVISYMGMGIPVVAAGFLAVHGAGLIGAARDYSVALIVLAALALVAHSRSRRTR
jgi:MFS family permease